MVRSGFFWVQEVTEVVAVGRVVLLFLLLQSYERDGWGEFPTQISPDRREIRPTADRWAGRQQSCCNCC